MIDYCIRCVAKISDLGAPASVLYAEICSYYTRWGPYPLNPGCEDYLYQVVQLLEQKQFVISTDIEDDILLIKPQGHHKIGRTDYFCCEPCSH